MPTITIANDSPHDQAFEVHGWNDNKNITIKAHDKGHIQAPDHVQSSGAIIALHDGHEGEQAEITFNGWQDMQTYDISVIVGAGGNLTIEQSGKPSTRKGDGEFMQQLRAHYKTATAATKNAISKFVTLENGDPIRVGAPKDSEPLETFIRTFANGKVYIGVGAWGNSKGNPEDNKQSSATPGGNSDLTMVFSDWHTQMSPHSVVHMALHQAVMTAPVLSEQAEEKAAVQNAPTATEDKSPAPTEALEEPSTNGATNGAVTPLNKEEPHVERLAVSKVKQDVLGDHDTGGPGILLSNKSSHEDTYYFFENDKNGAASFSNPTHHIQLPSHKSAFISLPNSFKGRVQRGLHIPATWVEFQISASDNTGAHGDISLEQGYDGPATIRALDPGSDRHNGFDYDIMNGAPAAAVVTRKEDGKKVLGSTMGNWLGGPNQAAIQWEREKVGQKKAYITGGTGTDDVGSRDKRMGVDFF